MEQMHAGVVGGCHYGQTATINKITDRFWWPSVTVDVRAHVRSCIPCQRSNPNNKPTPATLHPVTVSHVFHRWGVDLVGPLKDTPRSNRYMIVATEYLTRWVEAKAIPDKTAASVHEFLMGLVFRYGACNFLLHDQGREFHNNLVDELCERVGTTSVMSTAYHPQTNGYEIFIKSVYNLFHY